MIKPIKPKKQVFAEHGAVLRKESGLNTPKSVRLVIGNPLIMKEMAKHVPDAGSYAPEVNGFALYKQSGIALSAGSSATVNVKLQVKGVTTEVVVTSAAPIVDPFLAPLLLWTSDETLWQNAALLEWA